MLTDVYGEEGMLTCGEDRVDGIEGKGQGIYVTTECLLEEKLRDSVSVVLLLVLAIAG